MKSRETLDGGEGGKSCLGVPWRLQDPGFGEHVGDVLPESIGAETE